MPTPYELRPVTRADRDRWQRFVTDHPSATVFHTWAWLSAVDAAFGYDPAHHLVYEVGGSEPVAAVPGFSVPGVGGRTTVNPFCEYGFPLLATADVDVPAVLRTVAADVGPLGARVLKDAGWTGIGGYNQAGFGAVRTGEVIRLDASRPYDEVREASFSGEARRCIRSAAGKLTVRPASISEYYPLYLATMRRLGSPQFPESFFRDLAGELGDGLLVFVAERTADPGTAAAGESADPDTAAADEAANADDDPVGGILLLDFDGVRMVWSNASRRAAWDAHPNHRLYAAAIEDACVGDVDVVDFGRSRPGSGVHDFKRQFGGRASPLASFVTPPHRTGRASLEGYGRAAAVAERLSPVVTNPAVGPRLKRYIHE